MPFIAGAVSITFGTLTLITGDAMWVQIKVTLFNALVALLLWSACRPGTNFFRFVFGKTFHYTEEGWNKLTRNVALFFLATAIVNEAVRLGFAARAHHRAQPRVHRHRHLDPLQDLHRHAGDGRCSSGGRCGCCRSTACPSRWPQRAAQRRDRLSRATAPSHAAQELQA